MSKPGSVEKFEILMAYLDGMLHARVDLQKEYDRVMCLWPKVAPHAAVPTESIEIGAVLNKKAAEDCGLRDAYWKLFFGIRGIDIRDNKSIQIEFQDVFNRDHLDLRLKQDEEFKVRFLNSRTGAFELFSSCEAKLQAIVELEAQYCSRYFKNNCARLFMNTMTDLFARQVSLFGHSKETTEQDRLILLVWYTSLKRLQSKNRCLAGFSIFDRIQDKPALMHFLDTPEMRVEFNEMAANIADIALVSRKKTIIRPIARKLSK